MAGVKLVIIYPNPIDAEAFEKAYAGEQLPLVAAGLEGKTKSVLTRVLGAPDGRPQFHRIAEIHYPSMEALESSLASPTAQEVAANAISISSGGTPIFLVCDEVTVPFG
jgi:uncharacterized protein (TIGR02118 family)